MVFFCLQVGVLAITETGHRYHSDLVTYYGPAHLTFTICMACDMMDGPLFKRLLELVIDSDLISFLTKWNEVFY